MFSITTTEPSTFIPADKAKPPNEMRFKFISVSFIKIKAKTILIGISIAAVMTFLKLPIKKNRTNTASPAAIPTS
ncbi:hypothetical protein D3C72_1026630 [compost metagenome]